MNILAPVRKSLLRRITWFDGDRRVVGGSALLLILIGWTMFAGFGFFYALPILVPAGIWIGLLWVAREMNSADPWMVDVVMRHFKYRKYYGPKPDFGTEHPKIRDFI